MSKISVKTKNDSSLITNKPKVYFSCYPRDFNKYFNAICDDIFKANNCAIYYESDWLKKEDRNELDSFLLSVQLFVIPITVDYLNNNSRSLNYEYGFAVNNNIPILPIIVEDGASKIFSKTLNQIKEGYGDIQYLNKVSIDGTEIPYLEKLEKRLNEILLNDQIRAFIRKEFSENLFLSYRRKDRIYVNELLKLIHQIPCCWDVVIWYDEFLIAGEKWNQEIQEAIKDCKMMLLLVTPLILQKNNFIITHEYKQAKELGKTIIPIEKSQTDFNQVKKMYKDIDCPIDGNDFKSLKNLFSNLLNNKKNNAPLHKYFIGLAYINGIYVERNFNFGLKLITEAANANNPEAIQKLVNIYNDGLGINRDYDLASKWQEKLVNLYKSTNNYLTNRNLFSALWDLGEIEENRGNITEAIKIFFEMIKIAEERHNLYNIDLTQSDLASSYLKYADILSNEKNNLSVLSYYQKAKLLLEDLTKSNESIKYKRNLATSYERIGTIFKNERNLKEAIDNYSKALELNKELVNKEQTINSYLNLGVIYACIGDIYELEQNASLAKENYIESLKIREEVTKEIKNEKVLRDLSNSYEKMGNIFFDEENLTEAMLYYTKSFTLRNLINDDINTVESKTDLAIAYDKIGDIYCKKKEYELAIKNYNESLKLRKLVASITKKFDSEHDLTFCYNNLGDICLSLGYDDEALNYFQKDLAILKELLKKRGEPAYYIELVISLDNVGKVWERKKNLTKALYYHEQALSISEDLNKKYHSNETKRELYFNNINLGIMYKSFQKYKFALDYFLIALDICKDNLKTGNSLQLSLDLLTCFDYIGDIYQEQELNDLEKAEYYYKEAFALYNEKLRLSDSLEMKINKAILLHKIGNIYSSSIKSDYEKARLYYDEALEIILNYDNINDETFQRLSAICYDDLGNIDLNEESYESALKNYEKALNIRENSNNNLRNIQSKRDLSISYDNIAILYKKENKIWLAKKNILKSLKYIKEITLKSSSDDSIIDLAIKYYNVGEFMEEISSYRALKYYLKSLKAYEKVNNENGSFDILAKISLCYNKIGSLYNQSKNRKKALKYYFLDYNLCKEKYAKRKSLDDYEGLAVAAYNVGVFTEDKYLEEAYEIFNQLTNEYPNIKRYADNRDILKELLED